LCLSGSTADGGNDIGQPREEMCRDSWAELLPRGASLRPSQTLAVPTLMTALRLLWSCGYSRRFSKLPSLGCQSSGSKWIISLASFVFLCKPMAHRDEGLNST
jgi:hypothetical protein